MASADEEELQRHGGWPGLLTELLAGRELSAEQARSAMANILAGRATAAQLIGFVVALRAKGETADELSGLLDAVLDAAELVPLDDDLRGRAIDVVGTGGDRSHSINVSTMAALVVAGTGVPVCKHGARGASSQCGTADVLEELGVAIELSPDGVRRCVETAGIGFCFAPRFHPAFRFAAPCSICSDRWPTPDGSGATSSASPTPRSPSGCWRRCAPTAPRTPGSSTAAASTS